MNIEIRRDCFAMTIEDIEVLFAGIQPPFQLNDIRPSYKKRELFDSIPNHIKHRLIGPSNMIKHDKASDN